MSQDALPSSSRPSSGLDGSEGSVASGGFGRDLTFRTKLLLGMCGLVLLTGLVVIVVADRSGRANTRALVDAQFQEVSRHAVTRTRDFVMRAAPVAESLQRLADHGLAMDDLDRLGPQLLAFLEGNPGMTWVLYGDESGEHVGAMRLHDGQFHIKRTHVINGRARQIEYEVRADGSWAVVRQDDDSGYDPRGRPFYVLAKERGRLSWTPPYMFFTQGVPGISCVTPLKDASGRLRGVFSVEFDLNALSEFVRNLTVSDHSRVFLFTPDQVLLAHPNQRDLQGKGDKGRGALLTLADTGDPLVDTFRRHVPSEYVRGTKAHEYHFFEFDHDGASYMASTTIFPIGDGQSWVVGAVAPEGDFLAGAWRTRAWALAAALGALCAAAALAALLARRISRPVQSLIGFMERVGDGDLEARADFQGGREFRHLSAALNQMITDLRDRLQLRNSLQVAMEVQKSLLPEGDPVAPRLDIAGRSKYCDQTGGDYYDFIDVAPLSPSSLLIAVGDVMGHGIAAALLMASARAALHSGALGAKGLGAMLTHTNSVLSRNNRHHRFMTLSLLAIDGESGDVRWASAGHDAPIVFNPRDDSFQELEGGDLPLGVMEGTEYEEYSGPPLSPGGVLVIGTDGVWEMRDPSHEQYGKERLREVIRRHHAGSAAEIAAALEADLMAFRDVRAPDDDVTFVIIKLLPVEATMGESRGVGRPAEAPGV